MAKHGFFSDGLKKGRTRLRQRSKLLRDSFIGVCAFRIPLLLPAQAEPRTLMASNRQHWKSVVRTCLGRHVLREPDPAGVALFVSVVTL